MPEINKSQVIRDFYKANPKAKASEVVDALGKKAITVSVGLVNNVKSTHNKKQAAKRAAKGQVAVAKSVDKKPEVNKTQAIRDFLKANKKATTSEVVEALGKHGISVTSNYVSTIKTKHHKRRQVVKKAVATGSIGIPEIKAALTFLKAVGSVSAAKQALAAAEEIKKIV
jgi:hypothetical protein